MKSIRETRLENYYLVSPEHTNPRSNLYGGYLIFWMMETGYMCASRHGRGIVTLASLEGIDFYIPLKVSEFVRIIAEVIFVGNTSMVVQVRALKGFEGVEYVAIAYFSFVLLNHHMKPIPIQEKIKPVGEIEEFMFNKGFEIWKEKKDRREKRLSEEACDFPFPYTISFTRLVFPQDTYMGDIMFAGKLFLDLDQLGAILAKRFSRSDVVTASIDAVNFYKPIFKRDILNIEMGITYTGKTSIEIRALVRTENPYTGEVRFNCTSYLSYVCVDENLKSKPLPRAITPLSEREKREFEEADKRKKERLLRKEHNKKIIEFFRELD